MQVKLQLNATSIIPRCPLNLHLYYLPQLTYLHNDDVNYRNDVNVCK